MKKIIAYFVFFTFLTFAPGCNKDAALKSISNSLEGIWELRQASGQAGVTNYEPGNGNNFLFTSSSFQRYKAGQLIDSGIFQLIHDTTASENVCLVIPENEYRYRIEFNHVELPKEFIQVSNDSLYILSGCFAYDADTRVVYVKQRYLH